MTYNGILAIYKEAGMTSHDVVFKLRKILQTKKIGHGGTLDPDVTGVLPIAVGQGTRVVEFMTEAGKVYEGQVTLGFSTETEDASGEVVERTPVTQVPSEADIDLAMAGFVGEITQIPPMYSAVKVNGRKLYEYARAGETGPARFGKGCAGLDLRAGEFGLAEHDAQCMHLGRLGDRLLHRLDRRERLVEREHAGKLAHTCRGGQRLHAGRERGIRLGRGSRLGEDRAHHLGQIRALGVELGRDLDCGRNLIGEARVEAFLRAHQGIACEQRLDRLGGLPGALEDRKSTRLNS